MGYCPGAGLTTNYPTGMVTLDHTATNISVAVFLTPWACTSSNLVQTTGVFTKVSDGFYDVNLYGGDAFTTFQALGRNTGVAYITDIRGNDVGDCQGKNCKPQAGQFIGSFRVTNGTGGGTFAVPTSDLTVNAAGDFGNVCVTDVLGANIGGPQVPVRII